MSETAESNQNTDLPGHRRCLDPVPKRSRRFRKPNSPKQGVKAMVGKRCDVMKTGCRGLCANDVLVDIITARPGGASPTISSRRKWSKQIVEEHIVANQTVGKKKASKYYDDFLAKQSASS